MWKNKISINNMADVFTARMQARQLAKEIGFNTVDQARISLATSELAHLICVNNHHDGEIVLSEAAQNGYNGFQVDCLISKPAHQTGTLMSTWSDEGGFQRSISGACRLVDENVIDMENEKNQTQITLIKWCK
ncbi:hypothetical protein QUF64_05100 [Anaerolineales bacterium HSG6]|nr:hypothetical protein [Anaerolineales bacterium HSG6]MDM8529790.1 hypothetical protein [Anaerolineales bacterium HSG25]